MKSGKSQFLQNILIIVLGSALFNLGFALFLDPAGISCGGVTAISMLIIDGLQLEFISKGVLYALINIPLFFFGYKQIGKYFFFGSLLGMIVSFLAIDLFPVILPIPDCEPLVASVFGGVLTGAGLGAVFLAGASTGGVDIVARLMKLRFRNFPIGKLMLAMDLCTAVAAGIVYDEFNNTLYSAITLYICSGVLDKVVYGMDYAKVAMIISEKYEEIALAIDTQLDRGITLLNAQGFYKRSDKYVLLSAVKRKQLAQLKELVMTIDPAAFIILQDAHQVLGDGFKKYDRYEL